MFERYDVVVIPNKILWLLNTSIDVNLGLVSLNACEKKKSKLQSYMYHGCIHGIMFQNYNQTLVRLNKIL